MLFIFSIHWVLIIENISCEISDSARRFLRAVKLMRISKSINVNRPGEIESKCDIWEALRLYGKSKHDSSDLREQSRILLEQISKKAKIIGPSLGDFRSDMVENMSNLALRQMEILDLVEQEKGILEDAAHTINGILRKTISKYKIAVKEKPTRNVNEDHENKKYLLISDKPYEFLFRSKPPSLSDYGRKSTQIVDKNNISALGHSLGNNKRGLGNNKNNLNYKSDNATSSVLNWKRIFKKGSSIDELYDDENAEMDELYELIESLVYGSGKLKLLFGAFELIEENAKGVFSRLSWNLNEKLNEISANKRNS